MSVHLDNLRLDHSFESVMVEVIDVVTALSAFAVTQTVIWVKIFALDVPVLAPKCRTPPMSNVSPRYGYVVGIFCKFVKTRKNAMQCRAVTPPTPRDLHILCSTAAESLEGYCLGLLLASEMSKRPPHPAMAIGMGDSR